MTRIAIVILALRAVGLGGIVGALNADPVQIDLLWTQLNWPLGLVLMLALSVGLLLGLLLTWLAAVLPLRWQVRRLQQKTASEPALPAVSDD